MRHTYSEIRAALRYRDDVLSAAVDALARKGIYTDVAGFLRDHADDAERDHARQTLNVLKQLPTDVLDYLECRDRLRMIEPAVTHYAAVVAEGRAARRAWQTRAARLRYLIKQAEAALTTAQLLGEPTRRQRETLARRRAALDAHGTGPRSTGAVRRAWQQKRANIRQRIRQSEAALASAQMLGEPTHRHRATLARRQAALDAHDAAPPTVDGPAYEEARAALAQLRPELTHLRTELARLRPAYRRYVPANERSGDWRDADRRSLNLTPADWRDWDAQCTRWRAAVALEDFEYDADTGLLFREGRGPVAQRTVMCRGERVPVNWLIPWLALEQEGHRQADQVNLWIRPQCPYAGNWKMGYWWRWSDALAHQDRLACHSSGAYSRIDDGRATPPDVSFIGGWHWYMKDGRIIAPGIGEIRDMQIVQIFD